MPDITRLLIANRGEIARRVIRTCRTAGISPVAVFSDADASAPHAGEADVAVRLPGARAADTYLNGPALVGAARVSGADAVHPGYGFLAEDAGFARQVLAAGLTWIGPPPEAMEAMALKINARKIAAAAGVPVLPELDPAHIDRYPVLVKASAGGGGRGMRIVTAEAELPGAMEAARREAEAAFGDGTVFCEPLLTGARHVEVQVMADQAGSVWTLTERDCSVQRRYQKVIEETPSPAVGSELRSRLLAAAGALARSVGYTGAGTAEFLLAPSGEFYFLEFNTRLQVEHPVTECLHRVDLVAVQLDVARGRPLRSCPPAAGHAIEARLYAEDPAAGYRPAAGRLHAYSVPGVDLAFAPPGPATDWPVLRLDSGVEAGSVVSQHYDAMLAKVICWAPSRADAIRRLGAALAGTRIAGPATNRDLLTAVLADPVFTAGQASTALLDGLDPAALRPSQLACELSALAAAAADAAANRQAATAGAGLPGGWRNVVSQPQRKCFDSPRGRIEISYHWTRSGSIVPEPPSGPAGGDLQVTAFGPAAATVEQGGARYRFTVTRAGDVAYVASPLGSVRLVLAERLPAPVARQAPGSLVAPMPGNVIRVLAAAGQQVQAGQPILVIEAMKMEHQVTAPAAGLVTELRVGAGTQVEAGDVLAVVTSEPGA
jgi:propionyl-CoA carboxylase alpha chain